MGWYTQEVFLTPCDWHDFVKTQYLCDERFATSFHEPKGGGGGGPPRTKTLSPDDEAKRYASICDPARQTRWDSVRPGIGVQMMGDSSTVVGWLNGNFRCNSVGYSRRIESMQNNWLNGCRNYNARCPSLGANLWKHIYREGNTQADQLTWDARNNNVHKTYNRYYILNNRSSISSIWGCWDGGVSELGSAGGYHISVGDARGCWHQVASEAFLLQAGSTVTEAELSAAERLSGAVLKILRDVTA